MPVPVRMYRKNIVVFSKENVSSNKQSVSGKTSRNTTAVLHFGAAVTSVEESQYKLYQLSALHIVLEFLQLMATGYGLTMSFEALQSIGQQVFDKYLRCNSPIASFSSLLENRLCDITVSLNSSECPGIRE